MDAKHKKQLLDDLDLHLALGRRIFPLAPGTKVPPRGVQWTRRNFSKSQLEKYIERNHNLAWALGLQDCVLDLDPRHEHAVESFERLAGFLGVLPGELADRTAVVCSGGTDRGYHYYMRLPPNVKVKTNLNDYPDLEFRRIGMYVALPGSLHPSGRYYDWDRFSPYQKLPMLMPPKLLELLRIEESDERITKSSTQDVSFEKVGFYLKQLKPQDFRTRQDWLELAFMVHSTLADDGRELFLSWSTADPLYHDCAEENEKIWESIKNDKETNNLGFGSLVKLVLDKGGEPYRTPAEVEFDDGFDPRRENIDRFIEKIAKLPPNRSESEIKALIRESAEFGTVLWESEIATELAQCLGVNKSILEKLRKQVDKEAKQAEKAKKSQKVDYPDSVAKKILTEQFDAGKTLINAINQRFYCYTGTHWAPVPDNEITKLLYDTSIELKAKHGAKHEASTKVKGALTALIAKTTKPSNDVFDFAGEIKSVINCKNGELWLDAQTGQNDFRTHSPESYLLYCLDTSYSPDASCPVWDETLRGIFRDHKDPEGMVRHLHEIFGYLIQPNKDIAAWFLWHGGGRNGKTTCAEILQALMGDHAILPRPIHDFDSSNASQHALASLVGKLATIDDDADLSKHLPASALKKLAEGKLWEANPKHRDQFNFRSSATPVVLYNGWPKIKDITEGMIRKVFIVPFFRRFVPGVDEDDTIKVRIKKDELPGVLNRALAGLKRLRERRGFLEPVDCRLAKTEWLKRSNPIMDWLISTCQQGNGAWSSMHDLYQSYLDWSSKIGRRNTFTQTELESHILQRGLRLETREGNRGFLGIEVKK
jgi:P4 family phage/plasmid primase-like protien